MRLRPGEWVEVKGEGEILATLDERGTLDGLPFMPEMRKFCGKRFQVKSRADRTVVEKLALRRMNEAVHLRELRCDGAAHDGCCRGCLLFWKEAWLRPVSERAITERAAVRAPLPTTEGDHYFCQASELTRATRHLPAATQHGVIEALSRSIHVTFLFATPLLVVAFVVTWFLRETPLRETAHITMPIEPDTSSEAVDALTTA